ncbi:MAG: glycosyltransferase family 4 protein [Akkermansiaceae bacterium]|jgi:glycosyltransferase involved in cell wall biosynthesis
MKVLQILPELNSGGVERGTLELADYLVKMGHEALVVSNGGRQVKELEKLGGRHIAMPVHRKSLTSLFQVRAFRRLLEKEKPDILHIRSRVPGWIAWLAWRKMDPATRPRLVSTVHGFYSVNFYSAVMTKGERVIAVSESIREYILNNYPDVPKDKITVIYRGLDPAAYPKGYRPSAEWLECWENENSSLAGRAVFLLPGRITRLKGHTDFFSLLKELRKLGHDVHGLVVGDTHPKKRAYLDELRAIVSAEGLDNFITFTGHRNDIREIMAISDVVCALSQQPESFGRTVLEALAIGKPVLGYDCGGVGELLEIIFPDGRIKPKDAAGLLVAAKNVLTFKMIPEVPRGAFTLESMCASTLNLYQSLLR